MDLESNLSPIRLISEVIEEKVIAESYHFW